MDKSRFINLSQARVAIVGLGLMGGSLALALRAAKACREIIGVDVDEQTVAAALASGAIDRAEPFSPDLDCDMIVLATPVRAILSLLEELSHSRLPSPPSTTVLDLGSTKAQIVQAMGELPPRFEPIGGHPMCGREVSGFSQADVNLYRDRTFVLTPPGYSSVQALALVYELVEAVGAVPLVMSADRHDTLVAVVSHLPYAVAVALMRVALDNPDDGLWTLAASGFRDTSRLAASDVAMMTDILLTNRDAVLSALDSYRHEIDALAAAVESGDVAALRAAITDVQSKRADLFK
jgi:prephenate dehydrogenase